MRGDVSPSSPSPSSTIQSFMKDRNVIDNHPVRMGLGKELVGKAQDRSARLEAGSMKATPAARSDYLNKLRDAAETHWPEAMPKVNAAAEALQSDDIKQFAALAESARAELSHGYAERVSRAAAAKAGITPRDINKARSAKIGANLPDADVESAATSEMQQFAQDVREMQRHREAVSGGGATTMKSNAAGKEIEENLSDDWSRVGKSLGVSAPSGLDMTPGRIANAIEKGGGKDFLRIRAAFQDAAKQGRAAYRESQRESGVGPQALRQRALLALRRRMKAE
jgi:hypothetical protein